MLIKKLLCIVFKFYFLSEFKSEKKKLFIKSLSFLFMSKISTVLFSFNFYSIFIYILDFTYPGIKCLHSLLGIFIFIRFNLFIYECSYIFVIFGIVKPDTFYLLLSALVDDFFFFLSNEV